MGLSMKKTIVSIIIIGMLLSGTVLGMGKIEDAVKKRSPNINDSADQILVDDFHSMLAHREMILKYQQTQATFRNNKTIYVLVDSEIYADICNSLFVYKNDLENDLYNVEIFTISTDDPKDVRALLQNGAEDLVGALLVGNIPVVWCNLSEESRGLFLCDVYYMDLDGIWTDTDADGIPDEYFGDYDPDIWIGRLKADVLTFGNKNEIELLQNYFYKNHVYRVKGSPLSQRALWYHGAPGNCPTELDLLYDNVDFVYYENSSAEDYKNKLLEGYEWIELSCHSFPHQHEFIDGPVTNRDIQQIDPHTCFYNLLACSVCNYTVEDYIAGWYIFADSYGLVAVGETDPGGGANLNCFYEPLSDGKCIGEAVKEFLICWLQSQSRWALTIMGDPALKPKHQANQPPSNPPNPPIITGPKSGKPNRYYDYTFKAQDPEENQVYYYIDWGDNTTKGWIGPLTSGEEIILDHTWSESGKYKIRAKAMDTYCWESDWGYLDVTMPKNQQSIQQQSQQLSFPQQMIRLLGRLIGS